MPKDEQGEGLLYNMIRIVIETSNDAFHMGQHGSVEIVRILKQVQIKIERGEWEAGTKHKLYDSNGNYVGLVLWGDRT